MAKYSMRTDASGVHFLVGEHATVTGDDYHNAAVEFWQEIEQLRASQAELVEAVKRFSDCRLRQYSGPYFTGYMFSEEKVNELRAAIARVERKERN